MHRETFERGSSPVSHESRCGFRAFLRLYFNQAGFLWSFAFEKAFNRAKKATPPPRNLPDFMQPAVEPMVYGAMTQAVATAVSATNFWPRDLIDLVFSCSLGCANLIA